MSLNPKVKITLILLIACLSLSGIVFADTSSVFTGQINANGINVRVDSTVGAEVICTLTKGELVEVVREAYDWYKIRLPAKAPSYIKKNLLECNRVNPDFASQPSNCLSAKVIKDRVNIRLAPTESAWILGKVDRATVIDIIADKGDWYKIHPVYQSYGWVNKKFVNKEILTLEKRETSKDVLAEAAAPAKSLVVPLAVEGKVSPYGVVLWRKATHKLITLENKIYLLQGDRKSLDSLNYHKVKIQGKLITPATSKYPIIQIDIMEVID